MRVLKLRYLESSPTKIFRVCNFGNTLVMTIILFLKRFKIWCRFQKWNQKSEKVFCFSDNCIWIGSCKFSQYWPGYLPSTDNVLRSTTKISRNTMGGHIFRINLIEINEKRWRKCSHFDFRNTSDAFTCLLSKRVLKQPFWESGVSKNFKVCNFGNTSAMTIILFLKILTFDEDFRIATKSSEKAISFSDNYIWIGSNKFSQFWTGYLASAVKVLTNTPNISPKTRGDTFRINFPENEEKHDKSAPMEVLQVFGTLSHVDYQCVFWNGAI